MEGSEVMCEKCAEKNREIRILREENMMLRRQLNAMEFAESLFRLKEQLPRTLTTQQVAEFLQTSTSSARQLIVSGKIPGAFQLGEGKWARKPSLGLILSSWPEPLIEQPPNFWPGFHIQLPFAAPPHPARACLLSL